MTSCFTFSMLKWCMSIIRSRLLSTPSRSLSRRPPHPPYYQLCCHQPSHSFLFFPLTEKQRSRKGQCLRRRVGVIVTAPSLHPNNTARRLYPERVLACSLHFTRNESSSNCLSIHRKCAWRYDSPWVIYFSLVQCPHYLLLHLYRPDSHGGQGVPARPDKSPRCWFSAGGKSLCTNSHSG